MTSQEYDRAETIRLLINELIHAGCYMASTVIAEDMILDFEKYQIAKYKGDQP